MFNISKLGYYADFVLSPIAIAAGLALAPTSGAAGLASLGCLVAGFLVWTFAEYALHRWAFHGKTMFRADHLRHHRDPAPFIGASPVLTWPVFAALFAGLWAAFGGLGAALFAGVVAGYLLYIAVHDAMHHSTPAKALLLGLVSGAEERHKAHHDQDVRGNFGIAFPLWDHLLGTYIRPPRGVRNTPMCRHIHEWERAAMQVDRYPRS